MRISMTVLWLLATTGLMAQTSLADLRTEFLSEPLGVETEAPRFGWRLTTPDDRRNAVQQAYQIRVTDPSGDSRWDSGKIAGTKSQNIIYQGLPLSPRTRYRWTVTSWDELGNTTSASAHFETALTLNGYSQRGSADGKNAWNDAQWIGGGDDDIPLYSDYLSVFRLYFSLRIDESSTRAAFVFGANDPRLLDANKNLYQQENPQDSSYFALELDVSGIDQGEPASMHVYRAGYTPDDRADTPLLTYEIPTDIINADNRHAEHRFQLALVYGQGDLFIYGPNADDANSPLPEDPNLKHYAAPDQRPHQLNAERMTINPYGPGGDFISAPMVGEMGLLLRPGQRGELKEAFVTNYRRNFPVIGRIPDQSARATGETVLHLADPSQNAAPMLRTEFEAADKSIARARLYVSARGIYELYLNGERVGEDYFNPGLTQYNKTHFYQTYDVTDRIRAGAPNALGAWLGEGWWSGAITFTGSNWNYFGDRQSLLAQLIITYADGTEKVVTTNEADWKIYTDGPVRYGSFFQGEVYDARKEIGGWAEPNYDDSAWKPAVEVPLEGTAETGVRYGFAGRRLSLEYTDWNLRSQLGENATIVESLVPQRVEEVRPGVFVYDLGQNMVGVPRITLEDTRAGDTITLRYAEVRYPELPDYAGLEQMIMLENIRAALTQDIYVTKGAAREVIQPRFTFHGFRYLEITGVAEPPPLDAVEGLVISSVRELASSYETSNTLVNRFWENIIWSLRGNFLSIPTDTPARNERMGWNGDINVFGRAATWLADVNLFLNRHALAIRDMQGDNGRFSDVAPVGNGFGGTIWGSAGIVVPWENYRQFGDLVALRDHYPAMRSYVEFLGDRFENGLMAEGPLGDWLSPENNKNDNSMLWHAYYLHDLYLVATTAEVLGEREDARHYREILRESKAQFRDLYVDPTTGQTLSQGVGFSFGRGLTVDSTKVGTPVNTQASYAIPLAFNLFAEGEGTRRAGQLLAKAVERENVDDGGVTRPPYALMTGFIGTAAIAEALSKTGRDDLAYRMLQQEAYPGWLYPVKNGATTIWERLNSYTHDRGFDGNNSMNSFNHYSFGAVASWMYERSLGIQRDPDVPGFQRFILAPTPDPTGQMTFARGHYDSPYGRIESSWEQTEGQVVYRFRVPPNTQAAVALPVLARAQVQWADGRAVAGERREGRLHFRLGSGEYTIQVQ
ncbi:family 78 glycoside hydrolase catalytic domain [Lewinella sp. W8]|uniref:family 78 glycoside hydrolase catalytic domain n=1 Tax=Lewinella sp. W8 TaxID=2528208 RepID=UPI0010681695|nr:family 78 glycoside hydrolase catalytic domain [Lewinella sp. W8]MTB50036.1 Bacterial alpha-L-rhamnosidase [Lewinella sp. W8]